MKAAVPIPSSTIESSRTDLMVNLADFSVKTWEDCIFGRVDRANIDRDVLLLTRVAVILAKVAANHLQEPIIRGKGEIIYA